MSTKRKILIVDDEKLLLEMLDVRLSNAGYQVFKAEDVKHAFASIEKVTPDLVLLDRMLPDGDGLRVKAELNKKTSTALIPVIFLTARDSVDDKVKGLSLGADDYISKPFETKELLSRIEAAINRRIFYEKVSMTDALTGLCNIGFFKRQFTLFFSIAKRYHEKFTIAIIDIDGFKNINDTYGHLAGD